VARPSCPRRKERLGEREACTKPVGSLGGLPVVLAMRISKLFSSTRVTMSEIPSAFSSARSERGETKKMARAVIIPIFFFMRVPPVKICVRGTAGLGGEAGPGGAGGSFRS
jgi:hypothetical protein